MNEVDRCLAQSGGDQVTVTVHGPREEPVQPNDVLIAENLGMHRPTVDRAASAAPSNEHTTDDAHAHATSDHDREDRTNPRKPPTPIVPTVVARERDGPRRRRS